MRLVPWLFLVAALSKVSACKEGHPHGVPYDSKC